MRVERFSEPAAFRDAVEGLLLRDEPRHNLVLGLLKVLIEQPEVYPRFHLHRVVDAGGATACASLRTPPHMVVLAAPTSPAALDALVQEIAGGPERVPGVLGGTPEVHDFARAYAAATGLSTRSSMEQGIHVLEAVEDVPTPPGSARRAGPEDLELVTAWSRAFHAEAGPDDVWDEEQAKRRLAARLAGRGGEHILLWEDGDVVSLAGCAGPTRTGIRVGPVYTPPELRGRGYATGLVAHLSRELLASGRRFCFLYTDMANPTSNATYRRIGYRLHCGSAMVRFA